MLQVTKLEGEAARAISLLGGVGCVGEKQGKGGLVPQQQAARRDRLATEA